MERFPEVPRGSSRIAAPGQNVAKKEQASLIHPHNSNSEIIHFFLFDFETLHNYFDLTLAQLFAVSPPSELSGVGIVGF